MKYTSLRHIAAVIAMLASAGLTAPAFAQYVWLNEKGTKQYSDMPPPPSVPSSRILKQPAGAPQPIEEAPAATAQAPAGNAKPPMTTAEKNADFRKRRAERAEKEKKAAEQARIAAEKAKNCERARDYDAVLNSGERIARADRNGERSFLTDEQRAQELRDVKRMLQGCK